MGKTANCIRMLQLLNTGRVFQISELAELLETNPRNILEYKKELDELSLESNFYIETVRGRNGGYKINGNAMIPSIKLLPEEKQVILDAYNYALSKPDYIDKNLTKQAFGKILSNVKIQEKDNDLLVVDKYQLLMETEDIQKRYKFIETAIEEKIRVKLQYESLKHGLREHILDPYKLFIYNNSWFFLAWSVEHGEVRYYKLNRIKSYEFLNEKFEVWKYFRPEAYFDEQGLKKNGEYVHVEFIATGIRSSLMKERIYGKNQVVEEIGERTVHVALDMQHDSTILSFVLSCGTDIKVLEPKWLIDQVKEVSEKVNKLY